MCQVAMYNRPDGCVYVASQALHSLFCRLRVYESVVLDARVH